MKVESLYLKWSLIAILKHHKYITLADNITDGFLGRFIHHVKKIIRDFNLYLKYYLFFFFFFIWFQYI